MMKHTILILFLFLSLLCHGQSYKFFTTDRELSSSLINKIYQDRNGMIWIATEDGLNRYDGAKFITYKHDPENEFCRMRTKARMMEIFTLTAVSLLRTDEIMATPCSVNTKF